MLASDKPQLFGFVTRFLLPWKGLAQKIPLSWDGGIQMT